MRTRGHGFVDLFGPRLERHRDTAGSCGQHIPAAGAFTCIENARDPLLYGEGLDFLWVAGDGNAPTWWNGAANAVDRFTLVDVPVVEAAPWQTAGLTQASIERHTGASYRFNATARDPAAGQDAVIVVVGRMPLDTTGANAIFSTYSIAAALGLVIYTAADTQLGAYVQTSGGLGASVPAAGHVALGSIFVAVLLYDRTADTVTLWTPGATGAATAIVDGAIVGGGISLGAHADGTSIIESGAGIAVAAYIIGAGHAATWAAGAYAKCKEVGAKLTGAYQQMDAVPTLTRATPATWIDQASRYWFASMTTLRAGDDTGALLEPTRTNLCYRNVGIPLGALAEQIGDDASTATGVDDAAALAAVGLTDWGPNVCSYANATGASRYIRCGAATGAVTRFSLSVFADIIAGAGPQIGWWDAAGPGWSNVGAITDGYARTVYEDLTPPAATCVACIHVPDGCTLYWIGEQCEGSGHATYCHSTTPIPNWAAAATQARNIDDLVFAHDPDDACGSVELVVEPRGWSGAEGGTPGLLYLTGSGNPVLYVTTGTYRCNIDGTTELDSTIAPADGTAHHIRLRWTGALMSIDVRLASTMALLARVDGAYDGSLRGAGSWELAPGAAVRVRGFKCYRSGGG